MASLVCNECNCVGHREFFQMSHEQRQKEAVSKIVTFAGQCKESESIYEFENTFQNTQTSLDPLQFLGIVIQDNVLLTIFHKVLGFETTKGLLLDPLTKRLSEMATILQKTYVLSFAACFGIDAAIIVLFKNQNWEGFVNLSVGKKTSVVWNEKDRSIYVTNMAASYFTIPRDKTSIGMVREFLELLHNGSIINLSLWTPSHKRLIDDIFAMNPFAFLAIVVIFDYNKAIFPHVMSVSKKREILLRSLSGSLDRLSKRGISESYVLSFVHCLGRSSIAALLHEVFKKRQWSSFVAYTVAGKWISIKC